MEKKKSIVKILIAASVIIALAIILLVAAKIYQKSKEKEGLENATIIIDSVKEAEKKLQTKIPLVDGLDKEDIKVEIYGPNWPWHAYVYYSDEVTLEMARSSKDLVFPVDNTYYSTREEKDIGYVVVEYISENEKSPYKKAIWRYNNISYAIRINATSELDIEAIAESFINQTKIDRSE